MSTRTRSNLDRLVDLSSGCGPRTLADEIDELRDLANGVQRYREAVDALVEADAAVNEARGSERSMLWSELLDAQESVRIAACELPRDLLAALGWIEL